MIMRIRYNDPTNNGEEYWNGDIFWDELLGDFIEAVEKKGVYPCDIIIQNLDGYSMKKMKMIEKKYGLLKKCLNI